MGSNSLVPSWRESFTCKMIPILINVLVAFCFCFREQFVTQGKTKIHENACQIIHKIACMRCYKPWTKGMECGILGVCSVWRLVQFTISRTAQWYGREKLKLTTIYLFIYIFIYIYIFFGGVAPCKNGDKKTGLLDTGWCETLTFAFGSGGCNQQQR